MKKAAKNSGINRTNNGLNEIAYVDVELTVDIKDQEASSVFYNTVNVNSYIPSGYNLMAVTALSSIAANMWYWIRTKTNEITFCSTIKLENYTRPFRLYLVKNAKAINY